MYNPGDTLKAVFMLPNRDSGRIEEDFGNRLVRLVVAVTASDLDDRDGNQRGLDANDNGREAFDFTDRNPTPISGINTIPSPHIRYVGFAEVIEEGKYTK